MALVYAADDFVNYTLMQLLPGAESSAFFSVTFQSTLANAQGDSDNGVHQRLPAAEDHENAEQHGHQVLFHHGRSGMFGQLDYR